MGIPSWLENVFGPISPADPHSVLSMGLGAIADNVFPTEDPALSAVRQTNIDAMHAFATTHRNAIAAGQSEAQATAAAQAAENAIMNPKGGSPAAQPTGGPPGVTANAKAAGAPGFPAAPAATGSVSAEAAQVAAASGIGTGGSAGGVAPSGLSAYAKEIALWQSMGTTGGGMTNNGQPLTGENAVMAAKEELYYGGFYPPGHGPTGDGVISKADLIAMQGATEQQAINGSPNWQSAISNRVNIAIKNGTPYSDAITTRSGKFKNANVLDTATTNLNQFALDNGISLPPDYVTKTATAIANGTMDQQTVDQGLRNQAISAFPALKSQLEAGQSVKTAAAAYIGEMSTKLDIPSDQVSLRDPLLQKALQGTDSKGQPAVTPLWQFQAQIQQDPRWAKTNDAWNSAGAMAAGVAKSFGIEG